MGEPVDSRIDIDLKPHWGKNPYTDKTATPETSGGYGCLSSQLKTIARRMIQTLYILIQSQLRMIQQGKKILTLTSFIVYMVMILRQRAKLCIKTLVLFLSQPF